MSDKTHKKRNGIEILYRFNEKIIAFLLKAAF